MICSECKAEFSIPAGDADFYRKLGVPDPKECPNCRLQHQLAFWPFGKFHKRKCDFTGERLISIYPEGTKFPVYKVSVWFSDQWEPPSLPYDSSRPFFDQFAELQLKVPRPHQYGTENTNCDYSDDVWESKNCYLCRSLANCENVSCSYRMVRCRDSYDLCYCYDTEQSYDCIYCFKLFNVKYAFDSRDSFDSAFLYDCRNVRNCLMCWNLRNKEYCILNQQYSKDDYLKKVKEYRLGTWEGKEKAREEFERRVREDAVHKENLNVKCVNSTGNYLNECKNCRDCYFYENSENCVNILRGLGNKDSYDSSGIWKAELVYNICQLTDGYRLFNSNYCISCRESEYLDYCNECEYCFGCVGLKKKKYCILNKQYSEDEYRRIIAEIKKSMERDGTYGEFLPYRMACGGYNLSLGSMFFPKTKEEVEKMQGLWENLEEPSVEGLSIYPFKNDIAEVGDDVVGKALVCERTKRAFNITADELGFLKRHEIPLPHFYPDVRTVERTKRLFNIFPRAAKCSFCGRQIVSFYPEEFGYKRLACEECYQREVI